VAYQYLIIGSLVVILLSLSLCLSLLILALLNQPGASS
jgi:hypothetical protein